jgi:hypothetical protein
MVERLKNRPFALLGINSDEDRAALVNKQDSERYSEILLLSKEERAALPDADKALLARMHAANLAWLKKMLAEQGIGWRQAAEESTVGPLPRLWNVSGWPTIYVLDAQGRIRHKNLRNQLLEYAVLKLLDEVEKPARK